MKPREQMRSEIQNGCRDPKSVRMWFSSTTTMPYFEDYTTKLLIEEPHSD
jgi:hypothetical protein